MTWWQLVLYHAQVWWDSPGTDIFILNTCCIGLMLLCFFLWILALRRVREMQAKLDRYSHRGRKLGEERRARAARMMWDQKKEEA